MEEHAADRARVGGLADRGGKVVQVAREEEQGLSRGDPVLAIDHRLLGGMEPEGAERLGVVDQVALGQQVGLLVDQLPPGGIEAAIGGGAAEEDGGRLADQVAVLPESLGDDLATVLVARGPRARPRLP